MSSTEPPLYLLDFFRELLPPIHGDLTCHSNTLNVARPFVNFVALKFRSGGGHQEEEQMPEKKSVEKTLLALVFARLFFVNAYSYPKVPTHSTNCLLIITR